MISILRPCIVLFLVLTGATGIAYPLVVTGIARVAFPGEASGSLIEVKGKTIGSHLIGQNFSDPRNFWGRPSATSPMADNAANSGGSNLGPLNPALVDAVKARIATLEAADPGNKQPIPVDLVTTSASGLDPDISVAAANYQAARVARLRGITLGDVTALIEKHTQIQWAGFMGEPRVNVLELNLALNGARV